MAVIEIDVPLRVLAGDATHEAAYAQSWTKTRCHECALCDHRDDTWCPSARPEHFNGLMIVGEGPGANESRLKMPFVGRSGGLLDGLLEQAGIARKHTYITNATICKPAITFADGNDWSSRAKSASKQKNEQLDSAVEACHDRLLAEIEAVQPRVILALGTYALRAVTGTWADKVRQIPRFGRTPAGDVIPCPSCNAEMTLAWWKCPAKIGKKTCKHPNLLQAGMGAWCGKPLGAAFPSLQEAVCGKCAAVHQASAITIEKRKKRCPECGGRKTKDEPYRTLEAAYTITQVPGLVFRGPHAPDFWTMDKGARVHVPCRYVIGTYHPAFLLRDPKTKSQKKQGGQFLASAVLTHLRKVRRLLVEDAQWSLSYEVFPDHFDRAAVNVRTLTERLDDLVLHSGTLMRSEVCPLSVDIETDAKDPWSVTDIRCVGFHVLDRPAFVVNTSGLGRDHPYVQVLKRVLEDPSIGKVLQHGIYDKQVLWHLWGVDLAGYEYDTMAAHNAVHPDEPHDLGFIAGSYTDSPPWKPPKKSKGKEIYESSEQLHAYNARDVLNTSLAIREQLVELDAERARYVHNLDVAMFHVAADMERAGLPIDPSTYKEWADRVAFYRRRAQWLVDSYLGYSINLDSAKQLQKALYDPAGPCRLVPVMYTDAGAPSASREALLEYQDHPFVQAILDYRRWHGTVLSSLFGGKSGGGSNMHLGTDWRLRTRWNPLGARTGRWSTGGEDHGRKGNFQNWTSAFKLVYGIATNDTVYPLPLFPGDEQHIEEGKHVVQISGVRMLVKAPPGRKLVGADLSQAELRVLGALSGDPVLIDKCANADEERKLEPEWDPHSFVCAFAFGDAYLNASPKERKKLRELEKRVIYGSFYGAGAEKIRESIITDENYDGPPLTIHQVENILNAIWRAFTRVPEWRERTYKDACRTGQVRDALIGRRREFPLLKVEPTIAYNYAMQCIREGTRVLTTEGYVPVERAPCYASIGSPGQWSPSMTLSKRHDQVWRTAFANGHVLDTNEEHYVRVLRDDRSMFEWRAVGELRAGDKVAQPLALPHEFGAAFDTFDAYWVGYWIGNGSWSRKGDVVWCFGDRVGRETHQVYEARFRKWASQYGGVWKTRWSRGLAQTGIAKDNRLHDLLLSWGFDPTWRAKTKRVPEAIWRAALPARKAFLLGFMDADGTLSQSQPTARTPNLALLRDLQLLARTCGIPSRIDGPYVADRQGHEAYNLCFSGSLMRYHLGYGSPPKRQRFSCDGLLSEAARTRFLETYPSNPFSHKTERSFSALWYRLASGGWTNPHTLWRMYESAGAARDSMLYTTTEVASVEALDQGADMYTLAVEDELHSYDSAGVISKNSTVGSIMNMAIWELRHRLPAVDPSALILAQIHDAIYIEAMEDRAEDVGKLLEECMSCRLQLVEGAPYMPFPASAKIGDTWQEVS